MSQFGNFMQMFSNLQQELTRRQEELGSKQLEYAIKDIVTVTINGRQEILNIALNPSYITVENHKLIQDALIEAINVSLEKSRQTYQDEMSHLAKSLNLPNLPNLF